MLTNYRLTGPRRAILSALLSAPNQEIVDRSGHSTAMLQRVMATELPPQTLRRALGDLDNTGLIERDIRGRRAYRIALTDAGRDYATTRGLSDLASGERRGRGGNRERTVDELADGVSGKLEHIGEWLTEMDRTRSRDQLRLEMFRIIYTPFAEAPSSADDLALAMTYMAALNNTLLAAYRADPIEVDPALVDSTISVLIDLGRHLASLRAGLD